MARGFIPGEQGNNSVFCNKIRRSTVSNLKKKIPAVYSLFNGYQGDGECVTL